jgi:O-acetyl-ADP-ribose deacetylase (regulator of RNase III)
LSSVGKIANQEVAVDSFDLTTIPADAYVIPQFPNGISMGTVGRAIIAAGGKTGMLAYKNYLETHGGEMALGNACATSGGGKARYFLHLAQHGSDDSNAFLNLQTGFYRALVEAKRRHVNTIVAPAIETGVHGHLSISESAKAMMSAILAFTESGQRFDKITFTGRKRAMEEFETVLHSNDFSPPTGGQGMDATKFKQWAARTGPRFGINPERN